MISFFHLSWNTLKNVFRIPHTSHTKNIIAFLRISLSTFFKMTNSICKNLQICKNLLSRKIQLLALLTSEKLQISCRYLCIALNVKYKLVVTKRKTVAACVTIVLYAIVLDIVSVGFLRYDGSIGSRIVRGGRRRRWWPSFL